MNNYSKSIDFFSNIKFNELIIPDLIMVKEGIACGDKIILSAQVDNGILLFNFSCEMCCTLCKAACNYIQYNFNNKKLDYVEKAIEKKITKFNNDVVSLYDLFGLSYKRYYIRQQCLISPFEFFLSLIKEIKNLNYNYDEKPNTLQNLACDACTSSCRINWEQKTIVKKDHHDGKTYDVKYLSKWMPFGKISLSKSEIVKLKSACENITLDDLQFLSDYTMNGFILNHILHYYPSLINDKWKATAYLIQKNEINKSYFNNIKKYISKNRLNIYSVKGYVTQKYYDNPSIRVHSDYDLISTNSNDAFKLTNYLLKEGFSIRPNLFSFKKMNYNGKEIISGHFHVQKIIDDMYMFELDITFPGFPINRVDLFFPKVNHNDISIEGQIIITLLHLFKHEHVYIKDINDLYYMLKEDINHQYLYDLLKQYNLTKFLNIVALYINNNYKGFTKYYKKLSIKFNFDNNILSKYKDWPYDLKMHLKIKKEDLDSRLTSSKDYDRKYLFPVVIFKEYINVNNLKEDVIMKYIIKNIEPSILEINYNNYVFYLTPIGLFIDNYIDTKIRNRLMYIKIIKKFLSEIGVIDIFNVSYAYNHFYVRAI